MDIAQGGSVDDQVAKAKAKLLAVGEERFEPPLWPLAAALAAGGIAGCFTRAAARGRSSPTASEESGQTSGVLELAARLAAELLGGGRAGRTSGPD